MKNVEIKIFKGQGCVVLIFAILFFPLFLLYVAIINLKPKKKKVKKVRDYMGEHGL